MNNFWDNQSLKTANFIHSIGNLLYDEKLSEEKSNIEKTKIEILLKKQNRNYNSCLEIGAGTCQWTYTLSKSARKILCTDTSKGMLDLGRGFIKKNHPKIQTEFLVGDICKEREPKNSPYDLIFISGLILYLSDDKFTSLLNFISKNTKKNAIVILREPIGIMEEYILENVYSEELKTNYSAIYRTEEHIIKKFQENNFILESNDYFHDLNSKFNRWRETRLKLISLRRI